MEIVIFNIGIIITSTGKIIIVLEITELFINNYRQGNKTFQRNNHHYSQRSGNEENKNSYITFVGHFLSTEQSNIQSNNLHNKWFID